MDEFYLGEDVPVVGELSKPTEPAKFDILEFAEMVQGGQVPSLESLKKAAETIVGPDDFLVFTDAVEVSINNAAGDMIKAGGKMMTTTEHSLETVGAPPEDMALVDAAKNDVENSVVILQEEAKQQVETIKKETIEPVATEAQSGFEATEALSSGQKEYLETVNLLKEAEQEKQKQYDENRGYVYIGKNKVSISDFVKDAANFDKLDLSLVSNIQNLDLLVGKIPSEKIYDKLARRGPERMLIQIGSLSKDIKKKFFDLLADHYKEGLIKKYEEIYQGMLSSDEKDSFYYALQFVNSPLDKRSKLTVSSDYVKEVLAAQDNFFGYYKKKMDKNDPLSVVTSFKGTALQQMFRATEAGYIKPRSLVVEMTRDVLHKFDDIKRKNFQTEIIEKVLELRRDGVISEQETDTILAP